MRLSRSEFLVLREILKSEGGLSHNNLLKALTGRLSGQGLADALKSLQVKGLLYRDFMSKTKGSHALYKSTANSFDAVYANDMAEFVASKEVMMVHVSLPTQSFETSCLRPRVTMLTQPGEVLGRLKENEDFGKKLWGAAQHIISAWLESRQKNYNPDSLKVVKEYEEALAKYYSLFQCQMKKWAPGSANELRASHWNYVDPLDMIEATGNVDWPLRKYRALEEEFESLPKSFPHEEDESAKRSAAERRKLKAIVYNEKKRKMYEDYLKALIIPKTAVLMDFGVSITSARKHGTGEDESWEKPEGEPEPEIPIRRKSAFQAAKEEFGKEKPAST